MTFNIVVTNTNLKVAYVFGKYYILTVTNINNASALSLKKNSK